MRKKLKEEDKKISITLTIETLLEQELKKDK